MGQFQKPNSMTISSTLRRRTEYLKVRLISDPTLLFAMVSGLTSLHPNVANISRTCGSLARRRAAVLPRILFWVVSRHIPRTHTQRLLALQGRFRLTGWVFRALSVWFPPTKFHAPGTAPEVIEHHRGGARMHRIMSKKSTYKILPAIYIVDTIIDPDLIAIPGAIFDHAQD